MIDIYKISIAGLPSAQQRGEIVDAAFRANELSRERCLELARLANCGIGDALRPDSNVSNGDIHTLLDASSVLMHAAAKKRLTIQAAD